MFALFGCAGWGPVLLLIFQKHSGNSQARSRKTTLVADYFGGGRERSHTVEGKCFPSKLGSPSSAAHHSLISTMLWCLYSLVDHTDFLQ